MTALAMWQESRVLLIDDNQARRHDLGVILDFLDERFSACSSQQALELFSSSEQPALNCLLIGSVEGRGGALRLLKQLDVRLAHLPVLLIGEHDQSGWPENVRRRVLEHLDMPPGYNQLIDALHRAHVINEVYDEARERGQQRESNLFRSLVGTSRAIQDVRQAMQQVAGTEASVLLVGESGTGREVVARNLHYHSPRREQAFVPISCSAVSEQLLASELFGYEVGAFPGAITAHRGRLEMADGGTLFIDEVGDLPVDLQLRLLRVLQEGEFRRLGSDQPRRVDVRVIAATRHDLEARSGEGSFRSDLYYLLAQFVVELPPLRQRIEDIPLLLNELIARMEHERRGSIRFSSSAIMSLCQHEWRGNVRELANLVERLAITHPGGVIGVEDLPKKFHRLDEAVAGTGTGGEGHLLRTGSLPGLDAPALLPLAGLDLKEYLAGLESSLIQQALDDAGGVVARAAERLRVRRTTLVEKMRKYGMNRRDDGSEE